MEITFKRSLIQEAATLVKIYDDAFYEDYKRFGICPGYGKSVEDMKVSIKNNIKYTIFADNLPVGVISVSDKGKGIYYLGCLCIIPEYQGKGIGTKAIKFIKDTLNDWKEITLVTPAQKNENVRFYTRKCGFKIDNEFMDGKIRLYSFKISR